MTDRIVDEVAEMMALVGAESSRLGVCVVVCTGGASVGDCDVAVTRWAVDNSDVTVAGWAALSAGLRRDSDPTLDYLWGVNLVKNDTLLPGDVAKQNDCSPWGNAFA